MTDTNGSQRRVIRVRSAVGTTLEQATQTLSWCTSASQNGQIDWVEPAPASGQVAISLEGKSGDRATPLMATRNNVTATGTNRRG